MIKLNEDSEEFNCIKAEWVKEAELQTTDTLPNFLNKLMNGYSHDYGTVCHAIAIGSMATAYALNKQPQGGITGFQAGAVMWEFMRNWQFRDNKVGLALVDFDKLLYPQYEGKFQRTISKDTWLRLQEEASRLISESITGTLVCKDVYKHWMSIVDGKIPFGYTLED